MIDGCKELGYTLTCDGCGEEFYFDDFYEAVEFKKEHDWKSKKNKDGNWEEFCPDCAEHFIKDKKDGFIF